METNLINEIKEKIYNLDYIKEKDKTLIEDIICGKMNLKRVAFIVDLIIDMNIDKDSLLAFLTYQLFKVDEEKAEKIEKELTADAIEMVETYKVIKDISQLTLSEEIEDIKRMFVAMSKDMRVVFIKLAGICYDISILKLPLTEAQRRFVKQVEEIHVPLSERLGFDKLKQDLADNVIRLLHPEEFQRLKESVQSKYEENEKQLAISKSKIYAILKDLNIKGQIVARQKHISSIYNKLHSKNLRLNQIYDIIAMRVIVETVEECYAVLGRVHAIYKPMAGRVKDYIANPKPNGYKSLHTTIIVENQHPMEIQIRTYEMHRESEYGGVCAHWLYKEKKNKKDELDSRMTWFRETVENAKNMSNDDFINTLKSDLYDGIIFVQTPKGRVIEFPEGATAIDFAYAIHTDVGNTCVGAKINQKMKPLNTPLANGDIVEIITSTQSKGPSRDWLNFVRCNNTKSKIRAFFKSEMKEENIKIGKSILVELLQDKNFVPSQLLNNDYLKEIFAKFNFENEDELYAAIGCGSLSAGQVAGRLIAYWNRDHKIEKISTNVVYLKKNKEGVLIDGDSGLLVRFAGCCSPIEGDEIIGYISRGKGVTIHRHNCPNIKYLEPERLIGAQWQERENASFLATLKVIADKADNNIAKLTTLITNMKLPIRGFEAKDIGDIFDCFITIEVKNTAELQKVISSIKTLKNVTDVYRSEKW